MIKTRCRRFVVLALGGLLVTAVPADVFSLEKRQADMTTGVESVDASSATKKQVVPSSGAEAAQAPGVMLAPNILPNQKMIPPAVSVEAVEGEEQVTQPAKALPVQPTAPETGKKDRRGKVRNPDAAVDHAVEPQEDLQPAVPGNGVQIAPAAKGKTKLPQALLPAVAPQGVSGQGAVTQPNADTMRNIKDARGAKTLKELKEILGAPDAGNQDLRNPGGIDLGKRDGGRLDNISHTPPDQQEVQIGEGVTGPSGAPLTGLPSNREKAPRSVVGPSSDPRDAAKRAASRGPGEWNQPTRTDRETGTVTRSHIEFYTNGTMITTTESTHRDGTRTSTMHFEYEDGSATTYFFGADEDPIVTVEYPAPAEGDPAGNPNPEAGGNPYVDENPFTGVKRKKGGRETTLVNPGPDPDAPAAAPAGSDLRDLQKKTYTDPSYEQVDTSGGRHAPAVPDAPGPGGDPGNPDAGQ